MQQRLGVLNRMTALARPAVRPYCLRSKTWGSLRPHVHLCNNAP
ncbi:MAG: hypothetical protein VB125_02835 [Burkholderia sp.]